jgi:hypothetical protein
LVRGELTPADQQAGVGGYTFFGNLWAHHRARNPAIGGQQKLDDGQSETDRRQTDLNLVGNVIYNWESQASHRAGNGKVRINVVNNYYVNGPTKKADYFFRENNAAATFVYHAGNMQDNNRDGVHDGHGFAGGDGFRDFDDADRLLDAQTGSPFKFYGSVEPYVTTADDAYNHVIRSVGASLHRDVIDRRIVDSVVHRNGQLVDSTDRLRGADGKLPGIDDLPTARRPMNIDTDQDGMPDDFERAHGLDPTDPNDRNSTTLSSEGYTNLEVYLNGLVAEE